MLIWKIIAGLFVVGILLTWILPFTLYGPLMIASSMLLVAYQLSFGSGFRIL